MTGRGVKEEKRKKKEKSSRRPSRFPPSWYFYPACLRCWRCILVLSQPTFEIKTDSPAMQSVPLFTCHVVSAYIPDISCKMSDLFFPTFERRRLGFRDQEKGVEKKKKTAFRSSFLNSKPRSRTSCITRGDANSPVYSAGY